MSVGGCGAGGDRCWVMGANLVPTMGQCVDVRGQLRKIGFILAVLSAAIAGAGPLAARERVLLPFSCSFDHGRLRVERGPDHIYPILGHREQQPYTYCPDGNGARCKTSMVHRFAVSCAGGRAMWSEIVAAAAGRGEQNRIAIENGQLLLRVGAQGGSWRERLCADPERAAWGTPVGWSQCQVQGAGSARSVFRSHVVALPRGFAPLGLVGARVLPDAEPVARAPAVERPAIADSALPDKAPVAERASAPATGQSPSAELLGPVAAPRHIARAVVNEAEAVVSEPLQPPDPPSAVEAYAAVALAAQAAVAADLRRTESGKADAAKAVPPVVPVAWVTRVEPSLQNAARDEHAAGLPQGTIQLVIAALLATALLAATSVALRRRATTGTRRRADQVATRQQGAGDSQRALALRTKADGHIALITHALDRLAAVAPLRNALGRELQSSERRLAVVIAAISVPKGATPDDWTRARRRLERIAQDLDRLQQIADSAVSSLSGLSERRSLPRDKAEAYATLGVSPGVSEPILKKLVEALRISWHPDLAQGDHDRALRDTRIKEINVAWDLITGKRQSE